MYVSMYVVCMYVCMYVFEDRRSAGMYMHACMYVVHTKSANKVGKVLSGGILVADEVRRDCWQEGEVVVGVEGGRLLKITGTKAGVPVLKVCLRMHTHTGWSQDTQ